MAMKNYRDEGPKSNTKTLMIVLIVMAVAALVFYTLILPNWNTDPEPTPSEVPAKK